MATTVATECPGNLRAYPPTPPTPLTMTSHPAHPGLRDGLIGVVTASRSPTHGQNQSYGLADAPVDRAQAAGRHDDVVAKPP